MTLDTILQEFENLAESLAKEGLAFGKQAGVKDGATADETTSEQLGMKCSAGTYQTAAKAIRDTIKKVKRLNPS